MTYQWHPENIIKTDQPEIWANHCAYLASSLTRTAQLAMENDGDGTYSVEDRISSAAYTLEVAQALMAIVIDGTEVLGRNAGVGIWKKEDAA